MGNKIDLTGQRFGRLLVKKEIDKSRCGSIMWECLCDCGKRTIVRGTHIRSGAIKSCGCYKREIVSAIHAIHGFWSHPLYNTWLGMIDRCYDSKNCISYKNYGARGITICAEWLSGPKGFVLWAEKNGWKNGLQIDRIDNDKGYAPNNCRFATPSENALNTRLLQARNTSGFRGVSWHKKHKKYRAMVNLNSKTYWLGSYKTAIEAAEARDAFVIKKGIRTLLNFPDARRAT